MWVIDPAGKVIYAGSSNFAAWNIVQANERAAVKATRSPPSD